MSAEENGAADADAADTGEPAIPPGQEELLAELLGKGAALPGACELADGQVEYSIVKATYTCSLGELVIELAHPDHAAATATQTERFAIAVQSGSAPEGLTDTLAALIHSREAAFDWAWPAAGDTAAGEGSAGEE